MKRRTVVRLAAVGVVITVSLGWIVFFSTLLGVHSIEVRGAQTLSAATVEGLLAIPGGTPLARVDLPAAEAALESIEQVESAQVSRDWPATLVVQITERTAVAAVDIAGTIWLLDRVGVLFAQVSAPPPGVVWLHVQGAGPDDPATLAGLAVIDALDSALRPLLLAVSALGPSEIELELSGGQTVIWGSAENSARKCQVLTGLLAGGVAGMVYDVSSPTSAVVR